MKIRTRPVQSAGFSLLAAAALLGFLAGFRQPPAAGAPDITPTSQPCIQALTPSPTQLPGAVQSCRSLVPLPPLPPLSKIPPVSGIPRLALFHTHIPDRPNYKITRYTVQPGDSAWSIADEFDLQPETILWGNEGLSAEAGSLSVDAVLNILPVDGALHTVQEDDTWERIELLHGVPMEAIVGFLGNEFPPEPPYELTSGQKLIIPGGRSALVWQDPGPQVVPSLGRRSPGLYDGPLVYLGTGYFIWPIAEPIIITQKYWGAHPAIDLDTYYRQPIFASDNGTVIFSGWSQAGYGNLVIVDHGNGYWTYYAHNSFNLVEAGQGVLQGQQIAESGSTGNSTGDHIDFRIRVDGGSFINPLDFLP